MGCGSCGSGGCSTKGCGSGGCATGGCNKLNTYDWLNNMLPPDQSEADNIYEVRFKGTRKAFYRNVNSLRLYIGDHVVVESDRGYDIGVLSLGGVLAELQMRKKGVKKGSKDLLRIYRKANEDDLALQREARARDQETLARAREITQNYRLEMKLSDVEFQADNTKAIFYYISDHRVDFRELIKDLAREFKIRVEMRQIGLRHEAGLVGGIGSCGRELCCSTWLTDFQTVSTSAARYQNLSLNPMKISGLCGRLKCCLNFELDAYMDALKDFPQVNSVETSKGKAFVQKTDIFKGIMWFSYYGETSWYPLRVDAVKEVIALNKKGEKPELFTDNAVIAFDPQTDADADTSFDFVDGVGTTVLTEEKKKKGSRRRGGRDERDKGGNNKGRSQQPRSQGAPAREGGSPDAPKPAEGRRQEGRNQEGRTQEGRNQEGRNRGQGGEGNRRRGGRGPRPERTDRQTPAGEGSPSGSPQPNAAAGAPQQQNPNRNRNKKRRPGGGNRRGPASPSTGSTPTS